MLDPNYSNRNDITTVWIDMDGVLTDFPKYIREHCPENVDDVQFQQWLRNDIKLNKTFEKLEPNPKLVQFRNLIKILKSKGIVCSALTSLGFHGRYTDIHSQKRNWLIKHGLMNSSFGGLLFTSVEECSEKKYFSHKGSILIDDKLSNVNEFNCGYGKAFHYDINNHDRDIRLICDLLGISQTFVLIENNTK